MDDYITRKDCQSGKPLTTLPGYVEKSHGSFVKKNKRVWVGSLKKIQLETFAIYFTQYSGLDF